VAALARYCLQQAGFRRLVTAESEDSCVMGGQMVRKEHKMCKGNGEF